MKDKVVVEQSGISAGQMKDFWEKVKNGTIDHQNFGAFLESPYMMIEGEVTLARAKRILGHLRVIGAVKASQLWKGYYKPDLENLPIHYSFHTLKECAAQNRGDHNWRLIYINGLSLRDMKIKRGDDKIRFRKSDWIFREGEIFAAEKPEPGYYLIDLMPRFKNMNWKEQEEALKEIRPGLERCHEAIVANAILTFDLVQGESMAMEWQHVGKFYDSSGHAHIFVGDYWEKEIGITTGIFDTGSNTKGVVVVANWETN